ncbi:MAG: hypothetical protein ABUL73_01835 [Alphaproteobacteria bacterium]
MRIFAAATAALALTAAPAFAHGIVGDRFFPATLSTEDPFTADELALPTASYMDGETEFSFDYGKSITPRFAVSLGGAWTHGPDGDGFQNIETGVKYRLFSNAAHESIVSLGLEAELGGTGAARVGAESTSTVAPTLYFGRGFGDFPDALNWAKPLAVTGSVGYVIPAHAHARDEDGEIEANPYAVEYGLAIEYSLRYLAANVHDNGWANWVNQLTPLVEIAIDQPVRQRGEERTTGTINPGLVWSGRRIQLGAEAMIPINKESGDDVGLVVQLHYYLDDIFPHSLGRPLFGSRR